MKKIILSLVAATFLLSNIATAQNQKYGHIDSNELLMLMPERKEAEKKVQAFAQELEKQLEEMSVEYETKIKDFQAKEKDLTPAVKNMRVKEITDLEARIKDFQGVAQEEFQNKQTELMKPILDKAKKAIKDVAEENKFTYIFDIGSGALLYYPESNDVLPMVKKKLSL
jgi:outer membrane protein